MVFNLDLEVLGSKTRHVDCYSNTFLCPRLFHKDSLRIYPRLTCSFFGRAFGLIFWHPH